MSLVEIWHVESLQIRQAPNDSLDWDEGSADPGQRSARWCGVGK